MPGLLQPPYRPPTLGLGREEVRLLLPEFGIVPFQGREAELADLEEWCRSATPVALRVLTGGGGSGKSRLAAETAVRMAGQGWQAGFTDPIAPGGETKLHLDRASLLVVDDADLQFDLIEHLIKTVGHWPADTPPTRLLLLARHLTNWWDRLNWRTDHLAGELAGPPIVLGDGTVPINQRSVHHAAALAAFTSRLAGPARPPAPGPPLLDDPAFANPLLVHMHALLAALGADTGGAGPVRERVLDGVLDRERTRWDKTKPTMPAGRAAQAVTVATLLAPTTAVALTAALTAVPDLTDARTGERRDIADKVQTLYPGVGRAGISALRPDLLAEQLLATVEHLPDLTLAVYAHVSAAEELAQLLAELIRAAGRPQVHLALDRLLSTHLPDLLRAALAHPTGSLPTQLDLAVTRVPQPAAAADLLDQLPEHSTALAGLAVTLSMQAVDYHRSVLPADPQTHRPALAAALNNLSVRLGELGRREEALDAIEEAVTINRELARASPDMFRPALASLLGNLSLWLADLERREEALVPAQEAVTINRRLARARPDMFSPYLASSLTNLSNHLASLGRRKDALTAIEKAITIYRRLARARPDAFEPALALALNNLSNHLASLGRRKDALTAIEEAVTIRRRLARARPDAFEPALALALNNLSVRLGELGRREETLDATGELIEIYRRLAAARPDAFEPNLAAALNNLGILLSGLGRHEQALASAQEAVTIRQRLFKARPAVFEPDLARGLWGYAWVGAAGKIDLAQALIAAKEAVNRYETLAARRPLAFTNDLAGALITLADVLDGLDRAEAAASARRRAEELAPRDSRTGGW